MKRLFKLIPSGSIILATTTFVSYALGLVRDHLFANTFGASRVLDAYNAAFLVPDLLFNVLIASGIAAAFIPIFIELYYSNREKSYEYTNSILSGATALMTLSSLGLIIFSGPISNFVAPGFNAVDRLLVSEILRVLALSPILFGISNTLGVMLVAKRRFLYYGLSPVFYNAGIIGGTLLLVPRFGIMGIAFGTLGGALLHLSIRLIDSLLSGFRFKPNFNFKTPEFRKTIKLMIPKMFGHPVELATFWAFTIIASRLQPGSVAIMSFARNFQSVPVSLIGITVATTTFPLLAQAITDRSLDQFKKILKLSFWIILGGSVLSAIAMFVIREPLIRITLGGGSFTQASVMRTAFTLGMFTLAIPTESLVQLMARAYYATQNTIIPVIFNLIGFLVSISMAVYLAPRLDIVALPLAFFTGTAIELFLLLICVPWRLQAVARQTSFLSGPHLNKL